ncbi:peptidase S8 and S53 subtilisin kexin sedolisin [Cutibacterium avidum]|nr:S8 family serine peptidase [Cutibacterium avidum]MCO6671320.1 S8 family serine peptidase [Cutibacterium avidum]PGX68045.1 peptidase S8 and S53 subtilisin kexin sedolisin [Cutibacterium avidum]PGX71416.1 peptidase S8 and S53 subtilisin kexin sedolisin [Cutibacterium avidum]
MVLLKGQPSGRGVEKTNLAELSRTISAIQSKAPIKVDRRFGMLLKGFSAWVETSDIPTLEAQPGVTSVKPVRAYKPVDDDANLETGATAARKTGLDGRGTVVSIVDTGIDIKHQDMRLDAEGKAAAKLKAADGFTDKVPYGYNFADRNNNAKDTTASQHGMHVAGIVAANGGADADAVTNGRVNGAAPEAQLLAMKVFSNDPAKSESAYTDDIVAAIEESVRRGADVINMSLGSPDGVDSADQGEALAIANAQHAGVQVIAAAGNDGLSTSTRGDEVDALGLLDNGALGSSAAAPAAWSVASINNAHKIVTAAKATWEGGSAEVGYQQQAGPADLEVHKLWPAGIGKPAQVPAEVKGNWALIERGEISFADKVKNATAKGATGVIIFNNADGGNDIPGMAGIDGSKVPVSGMGHDDGQKLADVMQSGKEVSIQLTTSNKLVDNPDPLLASSFTSWGATPDLNFKPEIAGVGGSVYSTLNDNKYGVMSGTSMATPNVAGLSALMLQSLRKTNPGLSRVAADSTLRTAMSNTAEILKYSSGVPLAPRQIGAGLAQVDRATKTHVLATVDGKPNAALKEVNSARKVNIALTNLGDKPQTFTTSQTCVINEDHSGDNPLTSCSTGEKASAETSTVTVPAHGTAKVSWTVTPKSGDAHWIEGWFKFSSTDPSQPDLALPYMGFVGNWNAEDIIDTPIYSKTPSVMSQVFGEKNPHKTVLASKALGSMTVERGVGHNFFSPNGDGMLDTIFAQTLLLRSAQELKFSVVDANGKTVRELGSDRDLQHMLLNKLALISTNAADSDPDRGWDGKVWDAKKGGFVTAPEGKYTFTVQARLSPNFSWQTVEMPFVLDVTAPKLATSVRSNTDGTASVIVKVTDAGSGAGPVAARDGSGTMLTADTTSVPGATVFTVSNPAEAKYVQITGADRAANTTTSVVMLDKTALATPDPILNGAVVNAETPDSSSLFQIENQPFLRKDKTLPVRGVVSAEVAKVTVNGIDATIDANHHFTAMVGWAEGHNTYEIVAYDAAGKVLDRSTTSWIDVDLKGPQLTADAARNSQSLVTVKDDDTVDVSGAVSDDQTKIGDQRRPLTVMIDGKKVQANADGTFKATVTPGKSATQIVVTANDGVNVTTVALPLDRPVTEDNALHITFDDPAMADPNSPFGQQNVFLDGKDPNIGTKTSPRTYTLSGTFNRAPKSFTIEGKEVQLDSKLHFSVKVPINQGLTKIGYTVTDTTRGAKTLESAWRVFYDSRIPSIQLDRPRIAEDGAIYITKPSQDVTFAGRVWDNAFGYNLAINGNIVSNFTNIWDPGATINKRGFSEDVTASDGDRILLGLYDLMGNGLEQIIPVISDADAPDVEVAGVKAGDVVSEPTTITVKASDAHLDNMKVTLDGKQAAFKATKVVPAEGAEVAFEGEPDDTGATAPSISPSTEASAAPSASAPTTGSAVQAEKVAAKAAAAQETVDEEAAKGDAKPPKTGEGYTQLTVELSTKDLSAGAHQLAVTATDRADRRTDVAVPFAVDAAPRIEGPASLVVDPDEDILSQIRSAYKVVDDVDENLVVDADLSGLVMNKAVPVVLTAVDSAGHVVTKTVQITMQRPERTLAGECGTMRGRFAKGDSISITCRADDNGDVIVTVKNAGPAVAGTLTLNVPTDRKILVLENGRVIGTAKGQIVDGKVVLNSPSKITLNFVATKADPGDTQPTIPGRTKPGHDTKLGHGTRPGNNGSKTPHRHYQLPSTGGDPATGLTGLAGLVGMGALASMAVAAIRKSRR